MKHKNSDDGENWEDFILINQNDPESPQKRNENPRNIRNRNLVSSMYIEDSKYQDEDSSGDEDYDKDINKSFKCISSCCTKICQKVERYTKVFTYIHHTKLLLK